MFTKEAQTVTEIVKNHPSRPTLQILDRLNESFPRDLSESFEWNRDRNVGIRKVVCKARAKMLTPGRKRNRVLAAREFLERYQNGAEEFLDFLMLTGHETWASSKKVKIILSTRSRSFSCQ